MNRVLLSFCFLFAACGEVVPVDGAAVDGGNTDGDGGTGGPDAAPGDPCDGPSIELENLVTCFRKRQCENMVRCLPGFPDLGFCESRVFDFFSLVSNAGGTNEGGDDAPTELFFDNIAKAVAAGEATFNGDRAFLCLESLRDKSCKDDGSTDDCQYILTGDVPNGGACSDDFQCEPGAYCTREGFTCDPLATCQMGIARGNDCSNGQRCLPELDCVTYNVAGANKSSCEDGKLNSKCDLSSECQSDFYCKPQGQGQPALCVADAASGGACSFDGQCPGDEVCIESVCSRVSVVGDNCRGTCFGNLFCDPGTNTCQKLPGPNQGCSQVPADTLSRCSDIDHVCSGAVNPSCSPRTAVGMVCGDGQVIPDCVLGSFCSSELGGTQTPRCTAPQPNGSSCNVNRHCDSEFCAPSQLSGDFECDTYVACWE